MAYADTLNDIFRCTAYFQYPNEQIQMNAFAYRCLVATPGDSRTQILAHVKSAFQDNLMGTCGAQVTFLGCLLHMVRSGFNPVPLASKSGYPGTSTLDNLPGQTRAVITWRTDFAAPSGIGRNYLPTPTTEFMAADGTWKTSYMTKVLAFGNAMLTPVISFGSEWHFGIAHRPSAKGLPWTWDAVKSFTPSGKWGRQKRSGDYGKKNTPPELLV